MHMSINHTNINIIYHKHFPVNVFMNSNKTCTLISLFCVGGGGGYIKKKLNCTQYLRLYVCVRACVSLEFPRKKNEYEFFFYYMCHKCILLIQKWLGIQYLQTIVKHAHTNAQRENEIIYISFHLFKKNNEISFDKFISFSNFPIITYSYQCVVYYIFLFKII